MRRRGTLCQLQNTVIKREIRQFIEIDDQSNEADVPLAEPNIEFSHSKLESSHEERSSIFMAVGSQPILPDLAKQAMEKLFPKNPLDLRAHNP